MTRPTVAGYLRSLSAACIEVSRRPELIHVLVALLKRAPATIAELARAERMAA